MRSLLAIVMVALVPSAASAGDAAVGVTAGVGGMARVGRGDEPAGLSPGLSLRAGYLRGPHSSAWFRLAWATLRDDTDYPEEEIVYDVRIHWLEASLGYRLGRGKVWGEGMLGWGQTYTQYDDGEWRRDRGPSFGLRVGVDVHRTARDTVAVFAEGELLFADSDPAPFSDLLGLVGVQYQHAFVD